MDLAVDDLAADEDLVTLEVKNLILEYAVLKHLALRPIPRRNKDGRNGPHDTGGDLSAGHGSKVARVSSFLLCLS